MANDNYCNVDLLVSGKIIKAKIEKGITIEDNNGTFIADGTNKTFKMPNYRFNFFKAITEGYEEPGLDGLVLSKKDIEAAKTKIEENTFKTYLSKFLPKIYKCKEQKATTDSINAFITDEYKSQSKIKYSIAKNTAPVETAKPQTKIKPVKKVSMQAYKVTSLHPFSPQEKDVEHVGTDFEKPLETDLVITSNFRKNRKLAGRAAKDHTGWDLRAKVGDSVKAIADGIVTIAQGNIKGYGNAIYIDHGDINGKRVISEYGHLSNIGVKVGQKIKKGDIIGKTGGKKGAPGSGISENPHLHLTIREIANGQRVAVPPNKYIKIIQ